MECNIAKNIFSYVHNHINCVFITLESALICTEGEFPSIESAVFLQ